jgi:hypothetical protein
MESVLIEALIAAAPPPAPVGDADIALDRQCFGLMAELAGSEDPQVRSLGRIAAQYFLGRIDAATPGFDPENAVAPRGERATLLRRCGDAMQAGGRDFRAIGRTLAPPARPGA